MAENQPPSVRFLNLEIKPTFFDKNNGAASLNPRVHDGGNFAQNFAADTLNLEEYEKRATNPFGIDKKPWGVQGFFSLGFIPYSLMLDGTPIYPKLGFAVIEAKDYINQNFHVHHTMSETLIAYAEGEVFVIIGNTAYALLEGVSVVHIPPNVPHNIKLNQGSRAITLDPKMFVFGNREDNLEPNTIPYDDVNNQAEIIRGAPAAFTDPTFGLVWIFNPQPYMILQECFATTIPPFPLTLTLVSFNPEAMFGIYLQDKPESSYPDPLKTYPNPLDIAQKELLTIPPISTNGKPSGLPINPNWINIAVIHGVNLTQPT